MSERPAPLHLALAPSRRLLLLVVGAHAGAACASLPFAPVTWWPFMVLALGASAWRTCDRHVRRRPPSPVALVLRGDGRWTLIDASGREEGGRLLGSSVVLAGLAVLSFRSGVGTRRSVVLLGDDVDAEAFRRLRVRLAAERAAGYDG